MHTRPFAILEHTTPDGGVHHDLLIDSPGDDDPQAHPENGVGYRFPTYEKTVSDTVFDVGDSDDAKTLWAVRIDPPPRDWPGLGQLALTPVPPHRRAYLTYEGPISGGRGSVRRVAQGMCQVSNEADPKTVQLTIAGQALTLRITINPQGQHVADVETPG